MLPIKNKSQNKCSDSISDSIDYNQMRILYLKLASIIKRNNDQTKKTQFTFVIKIINRKPYIL